MNASVRRREHRLHLGAIATLWLSLQALPPLRSMVGRRLLGTAVSVLVHGSLMAAFILSPALTSGQRHAPGQGEAPSMTISLIRDSALSRISQDYPSQANAAAAPAKAPAAQAETLRDIHSAPVISQAQDSPISAPAASQEQASNASAVASASNASAASALAASDYGERLLTYIEQHRRLNPSGRTGVVRLVVSLDRRGAVLDVRVANGSGVKALDDEAQALIWRAQPMPAIPPELPDRLTLTLPLTFTAYGG